MNKKTVTIVVAVIVALLVAFGVYSLVKPKSAPEPAATEAPTATEAPAEEEALAATEAPAEETASAKTKVTIWHTFTDAQQEALEAFASEFNASQSDYEVVVESQAYSGFLDSVYMAVANGQGPNIIINYASEAARYVPDNLVLDLAPYINDPEIGMADIYDSLPEAIKAETVGFEDGGLHALPAVTTGPILFVNKTLFEELGLNVPTTWEELAEVSKTIYEKKGIPGFAADSKTDLLQSLFMQSGAGYIDLENKKVLFDTEDCVKWLDWYGENIQNGYFKHMPETGDYISGDFNAGLVACYLGSCAGYPYIEPDGFEFIMAPMPDAISTAWYPSWNRGPIVFNKTEEENKGAYLFLKYFFTPEVNARWAEAMNAISPYGTTQDVESYKAYIEGSDQLLRDSLNAVSVNLSAAGALPSITGASEIRTFLEDAATAVAGGMSGADAMKTLVEDSNAALNQ